MENFISQSKKGLCPKFNRCFNFFKNILPIIILLFGTVLTTLDGIAQVVPIGSEYRINTFTTGHQSKPAIAMDSVGNYVVTWESENQDGSSWGIYAQSYNADGTKKGTEFKVNTYTLYNQQTPKIAMDKKGNFVITWASYIQVGNGWSVFAQRYDKDGLPQGSEFRVNTAVAYAQLDPSIAMDSDGDFVITWAGTGQSLDIHAKRYNALGVVQGADFVVNTNTRGEQRLPSIAMDDDGDFVICWQNGNPSADTADVCAQRYNKAGVAQGSEFLVNTYKPGNQDFPAVAIDSIGNFVIAWETGASQEGSWTGIYAQRYDASGSKQGTEFGVNTYTTDYQLLPAIDMNSKGEFIISWSSLGQDGNSFGVYAQRYYSSGLPNGSEFRTNSRTTGEERDPAVAIDSKGKLVVTWMSNGQDGDLFGIYAQNYGSTTMPTAVEETVASSQFTLSPNPAKDQVKIQLQGEATISIIDLLGNIVLSEVVTESSMLNIEVLKAGLYIVKVNQGDSKIIKKLIVE